MKGHLKRNRMTQISASKHLPLRSKRTTNNDLVSVKERSKSTAVTTFTILDWDASCGTHNSSLEGAMKLEFAPFCSS